MKRFTVAAVALLAGTVVTAQKQALTDQDKADAVRIGTKEKGKITGLILIDSARAISNGFVAGLNPNAMTDGVGFSLRVYTPTTWVRQIAADAAKEYRPFDAGDITDDMLEPMLRVIVFPDKPTRMTGAGMAMSSSVQHVVLRDEAETLVLQPFSKEPFADTASSALRDVNYEGIVARFPLEGVRALRGPKGDKEFLIIVIGATRSEKTFKVKGKHFDRLP